MKVDGRTIANSERDLKFIRMEIDMRDILLMEKAKAQALMSGEIRKFIMANG